MHVWCETAISSLDRAMWHGKNLKVSMSKHANIQMPRDSLPVSCSTISVMFFEGYVLVGDRVFVKLSFFSVND